MTYEAATPLTRGEIATRLQSISYASVPTDDAKVQQTDELAHTHELLDIEMDFAIDTLNVIRALGHAGRWDMATIPLNQTLTGLDVLGTLMVRMMGDNKNALVDMEAQTVSPRGHEAFAAYNALMGDINQRSMDAISEMLPAALRDAVAKTYTMEPHDVERDIAMQQAGVESIPFDPSHLTDEQRAVVESQLREIFGADATINDDGTVDLGRMDDMGEMGGEAA